MIDACTIAYLVGDQPRPHCVWFASSGKHDRAPLAYPAARTQSSQGPNSRT
jgi:hypothetical protein